MAGARELPYTEFHRRKCLTDDFVSWKIVHTKDKFWGFFGRVSSLLLLDRVTCNIDSWSTVLDKFQGLLRNRFIIRPIWRQCVREIYKPGKFECNHPFTERMNVTQINRLIFQQYNWFMFRDVFVQILNWIFDRSLRRDRKCCLKCCLTWKGNVPIL